MSYRDYMKHTSYRDRVLKGVMGFGKDVAREALFGPRKSSYQKRSSAPAAPRYTKFGKGKWMSGEKGEKTIAGLPYTPSEQKEIEKLVIRYLDAKQKFAGKKYITADELLQTKPEFIKELGPKKTELLFQRLGLGENARRGFGTFSGGKAATFDRVDKIIHSVSELGKTGQIKAGLLAMGLDPLWELAKSPGFTEEQFRKIGVPLLQKTVGPQATALAEKKGFGKQGENGESSQGKVTNLEDWKAQQRKISSALSSWHSRQAPGAQTEESKGNTDREWTKRKAA